MEKNESVFLRWEKWRIVYNLILLFEGIWVLREHLQSAFSQFFVFMILFAIVANICFFLGPLIEVTVRKIARSHAQLFLKVFPYALFWAGLAFSMWWAWMWSLRGLGHLGGSNHYVYTSEFRDQTWAFLSFLAWGTIVYATAIAVFEMRAKARSART